MRQPGGQRRRGWTVLELAVGLKGKAPYLRARLGGPVHDDETVWTVEDGALKLELSKASTGDHWRSVLQLPEGWECVWS